MRQGVTLRKVMVEPKVINEIIKNQQYIIYLHLR